MVATVGDDASTLSTVKKWAAELKRVRESLKDDPRSERFSAATTQENFDRIHQTVMDGRHVSVYHIADVLCISCERVKNILHKELSMSKASARWIPWLLTPDQKLTRLVVSQANLAMCKTDPDGFVERFLTQDARWVHHFKPEAKRQFMQWKHITFFVAKKANVVPSA